MNRLTRCVVVVLVFAIAAAAVMVGLVATGSRSSASVQISGSAEAATSSMPTMEMSADFLVTYTDMNQLGKAAEVIVRGEVIQVSYVDYKSTAYTKTTLKVSECLKGGLAEGEQITIMEVGGIISMASIKGDKFGEPTAEDRNTQVKVLLEGAPLSEVGEMCLYFLGKGSLDIAKGAYYVPLGAFQGRFTIKDSVAERYVPADWAGGRYDSLSTAEDNIDKSVLQGELER